MIEWKEIRGSRFALIAAVALAGSATSVGAAVIAATNFNGRLLSSTNTATNLSWVTNGVSDPGDLSAFQWGGAAQGLFNLNSFTQNLFAPGLNVGNAGTNETKSWTTSVALTVLSGFTVSLESVSFDYWAVNGGQAQNVLRASDFTVALFSPSLTNLGEVSIADVPNGGTPGSATPVLLTFASAIALTDPGTYTLRIRGGDFVGFDETGNHTGIDNLSINGTIPEPSAVGLLGLGLLGLASRRCRA